MWRTPLLRGANPFFRVTDPAPADAVGAAIRAAKAQMAGAEWAVMRGMGAMTDQMSRAHQGLCNTKDQ